MKRVLSFIMGFLSVSDSLGQSELMPDSMSIPNDNTEIAARTPLYQAPVLLFSSNSYSGVTCTYPYSPASVGISAQSSLPRWLTFSADRQSYPGLMQVDSGSIGFAASTGNFSYGAYAGAIKYGSFRSLVTSFYVGAEASYRFSPSLSLTVFGTYYSRNPYLGMAAFPYVPTNNFGGYVTISPNSNFALSLGARSYYDTFGKRMEIDPIIAPTVKVGKIRVGIDMGHAAKHYLRSLFQSWSK